MIFRILSLLRGVRTWAELKTWNKMHGMAWSLWCESSGFSCFFEKKYHDSNWILNIIYLFNVISCHLSLNIFEQLFTWAADLVSRMRALTMSCVWPQLTGLGASLAECLPTWRQVPWQVRWLGFLLYRKLYTVSHDDLRLGRVFFIWTASLRFSTSQLRSDLYLLLLYTPLFSWPCASVCFDLQFRSREV